MGLRCNKLDLSEGWKWRSASSNNDEAAEAISQLKEWTPVSHKIPSVIHTELLASGAIPDYRLEDHERSIQWIGQVDWEYACSFDTPDSDAREIDLVFEGLDTFATVTLNGTEILKSDNAFLTHRVPVKKHLRPMGQKNELSVLVESVLKKTRELEQKYGKRTSIMRDPARNHVRKPAYHWGWDWGPVILTAGPWKPIYLQTYDARIENVHVVSTLAADHKSAELAVNVQIAGTTGKHKIEVKVSDQQGQNSVHQTIEGLVEGAGSAVIKLVDPRLWWPNRQGEQHLYTVDVVLFDQRSEDAIESSTLRYGIRTITLIQRPLSNAPGTTFLFNVNGRDIFSQGANWIPADNLLPTLGRQRYFDWIKSARFNNLNMIRVWGGGIYETNDFFDACDELGLLVWHDFAFACGDYPTHSAYLENIKKEAAAQLMRLRNRTSLALLCGGNEDFMLNDWTEVKYDFKDTKGPFLDKPTFPQREIYLRVLPEACKSLCSNIQYWPSSPWGGKNSSDPTVGDIHQWGVWHINQKPYQEYKDISGRFVSEFGMHAFPVERTVNENYFTETTPAHIKHPQSQLVDCRNKGHGAETRLARYLAENFRYDNNNLSNWIYSTQLLQSEAYSYAYRDWKRKFAGKGKEECAGALVWQLNDVYPTASWAIIDYYLRPHPAAYTIRRACARVSVGIQRTPASRWINEDTPAQKRVPSFEIFAHNMSSQDQRCVLLLEAYDFHTGKWTPLESASHRREVTLKAEYNTELASLPSQPSWSEDSLIILQATLADIGSKTPLARHVSWPEPYRYLYWPKDTKVDITVQSSSEGNANPDILGLSLDSKWSSTVTIRSNQPIKGVWLEPVYDGTEKIDELEPLWEDNMVDLMPDQELKLGVNGLRNRKVKARFLYDWELK